jgi:hypothetical protein
VPLDPRLIDGLALAVTESAVVDVAVDRTTATVTVYLDGVLSARIDGRRDTDLRRALELRGASALRVCIRQFSDQDGPALPIRDVDELRAWYRRLTWWDAMYDDEIFDTAGASLSWPATISLDERIATSDRDPAHTMWWFLECGRNTGDELEAYVVHGIVHFDDIAVRRADGSEVPVKAFAADGLRYWRRPRDVAIAEMREPHVTSPRWW